MRISHAVIMAIALVLGSPGVATAIEGTWATNLHSTGPNAEVTCLLRWQGDVYAAGTWRALPSGTYLLRLTTGGVVATAKAALVRQEVARDTSSEVAGGSARSPACGPALSVLT